MTAAEVARAELNRAVKRGDVRKPKRCSRCRRRCGRIEAHHADHSRPLDVTWLGSRCHGITRRRVLSEGDIPATLWRDVKAKAKREGISIRALLLKALTQFVERD